MRRRLARLEQQLRNLCCVNWGELRVQELARVAGAWRWGLPSIAAARCDSLLGVRHPLKKLAGKRHAKATRLRCFK
jgi:hypothetical protein